MDMYSTVRNRMTVFALASALLSFAPGAALAETGTPPQQAAAPGQQTAFSTTQAAPLGNGIGTDMSNAAESRTGLYSGSDWDNDVMDYTLGGRR